MGKRMTRTTILAVIIMAIFFITACAISSHKRYSEEDFYRQDIADENGNVSQTVYSTPAGWEEGDTAKLGEYTEKIENGITRYQVGENSFDYRIKVTGRSNNAAEDSYYIVLTNDETITFQMVDERFWSSETPKEEDFVIVEFGSSP
jgi:ssDNA-binding replication factor A large subunit